MRLILLWLLWAGPLWAESRLQQLLQRQREAYSQAVVTSGFYEARSISRYRSQPGLHSGYDIAMPAGTLARVAWDGRVRAIVPWAEGEWGVVVEHADGTTATYGHILPVVSIGLPVRAGQAVGSIARDHLDVKMRNAQGLLFDYGSGAAASLAPEPPAVLLPGPAALEFQRRLRVLVEPPGGPGRSLASAALGSELAELEKLRSRLSSSDWQRLRWEERDRKKAELCSKQLEAVKARYDLGFVSLRRLQEAERLARLWKRL